MFGAFVVCWAAITLLAYVMYRVELVGKGLSWRIFGDQVGEFDDLVGMQQFHEWTREQFGRGVAERALEGRIHELEVAVGSRNTQHVERVVEKALHVVGRKLTGRGGSHRHTAPVAEERRIGERGAAAQARR